MEFADPDDDDDDDEEDDDDDDDDDDDEEEFTESSQHLNSQLEMPPSASTHSETSSESTNIYTDSDQIRRQVQGERSMNVEADSISTAPQTDVSNMGQPE